MNDTLQFPLPILAFGNGVNDRLEHAITYATVSTGIHRLKTLPPALIEAELDGEKLPKGGSGISVEQIRIIALGCKFCGVRIPETNAMGRVRFNRYDAAEKFLQDWKADGRTIPWTRVPKAMVFEARDGNAATYWRFAALCAVNAAIGSKPFAIVTANRVRAGMLGYSSGKVLFSKDGSLTPAGSALLATRADEWRLSTRSQARTLLDNLVESGLLHRFNEYRGGLTFYSKSLSAEQIAERLLIRASRKACTSKLAKLSEAIRQAKQDGILLSGDVLTKSPLNTDPPRNKSIATTPPPDSHPVATPSPHNAASYASSHASLNASQNAEPRARLCAEKAGAQIPEASGFVNPSDVGRLLREAVENPDP